jgi:hypothetical protein
MLVPFVALTIVAQLAAAAAEPVPDFDVEPTCRAAERAAPSMHEDMAGCIAQERSARAELASKWSHFRPADRDRCIGLARVAPEPSYVELLTCLEIASAANALPEERESLTTGRGQ